MSLYRNAELEQKWLGGLWVVVEEAMSEGDEMQCGLAACDGRTVTNVQIMRMGDKRREDERRAGNESKNDEKQAQAEQSMGASVRVTESRKDGWMHVEMYQYGVPKLCPGTVRGQCQGPGRPN